MKRSVVFLLSFLLSAFLIAPASPATAAPYCGIYWGSLAKTSAPMSQDPIVNVRTGRHECYDRLVVDVRGDVGGYDVRYVSQITGIGSGAVIPTRGGARLAISVHDPAYDAYGHATYLPANRNELTNVTGYQTFRQVVWAGSYEGYSSIGLGVRARLPFRVFTLDGPGGNSRLVIDVAHRW